MSRNIIVTLSGQSSSGKSTLENMLVNNYFDMFDKVISHTTRPIRFNEENGEDYHFVNDKDFDSLEMMESVSFNGNKYGASKNEFQRIFNDGKIPVIVVTPEGVDQIQEKCDQYDWELLSVFLDCPDKILVTRIFDRFFSDVLSNDDKEKVYNTYMKRIDNMFDEEKSWKTYCNWSMVFDEFTSQTEIEVVQSIVMRLA